MTIQSDVPLIELGPFETTGEAAGPHVNVVTGNPTIMEDAVKYTESPGRFGSAVALRRTGGWIEAIVSPLLSRSAHVLYNNVVEPILRFELLRTGHALLHAACVVRGDEAFLITAKTDTGKTSTVLRLVEGGDLAFLSDDMCVVTPEGDVLTFPKPMTISAHTLAAIQRPRLTRKERTKLAIQSRVHSRRGRTTGLLLAKSRVPAATLSAALQIAVPPPKYDVGRLVPHVRKAERGQVAGVFVIERGDERIERIAHPELLRLLISNTQDAYGFPPYTTIEEFLRHDGANDLKAAESRIFESALGGIHGLRLRSVNFGWPEQISRLLGVPS